VGLGKRSLFATRASLSPGRSLEDAVERLGGAAVLGPASLRIAPGDGTMDLD